MHYVENCRISCQTSLNPRNIYSTSWHLCWKMHTSTQMLAYTGIFFWFAILYISYISDISYKHHQTSAGALLFTSASIVPSLLPISGPWHFYTDNGVGSNIGQVLTKSGLKKSYTNYPQSQIFAGSTLATLLDLQKISWNIHEIVRVRLQCGYRLSLKFSYFLNLATSITFYILLYLYSAILVFSSCCPV